MSYGDPTCEHEHASEFWAHCQSCVREKLPSSYLKGVIHRRQNAIEFYCATCGRVVMVIDADGQTSQEFLRYPEGLDGGELLVWWRGQEE